jgi:acetyl esterase/lipase
MRRSNAIPAALLTLAATLLLAAPAVAAKPVVLTIHGGGYFVDDTAMMAAVDASFEAAGFKSVPVDYTLGDIRAGWRDVRRAARRFPHRRVYAYGESAGGGFAALLATTRLIDGAVVHSPIVDLRAWGRQFGSRFRCETRRCWKRFSPARRKARAPVLEFVPTDDVMVDPTAALKWASRDPRVRARVWPGWHMAPSRRGRDADLRRAASFLHRLAGR